MPTLITAGDATNSFVMTAGNDNTITIQSGPNGGKVNALSIDTTGNVGIGTSSPFGVLNLQTGTNARVEFTSSTSASLEILNNARNAYLNYNTYALNHTWNRLGAESMRLDSSGNLLVGTINPGGAGGVSFRGNTADTTNVVWNRPSSSGTSYPLEFQNGGSIVGFVSYTNTVTTYTSLSDYRLKNTITPMTGALAKVQALKPVTYKWNADGSDGQGFIAHELQAVVPNCVTGEKDAVDENGNPQHQGIDTSFLVATLTAAIQEQQALITSLTDRLTALENK